ncbi:hypothetical protein MNB_SM-6-671 [hydrothermal vent metagenome]|uniref:Lipoprotein n=1 Tax=hydrothermal vent metagenome TaxID=652676 RepID=A0A1W1CW29_9ZZZZ
MKKNLTISLVFLLSTLFFSACSTTTQGDIKSINYTHFKQRPLKKVHKLIVQAGQEDGWRMTEFKENELIAEKTENGKTKAVTITFSQNYFHLSPEDDDLEDAIENKLEL